MKTRDQIRQYLIKSLLTYTTGSNNTSNWSSLIQSVVGSELLNFGVEVLAMSEDLRESYVKSFDYNYADIPNLLQIARRLNIPITFNKPAKVVVALDPTNEVYPPFSIKLQAGNATFYNTSYVYGTNKVVLIQGDKFEYSDTVRENTTSVVSRTQVNVNNTTINYFKLSSVIPESINLLVKDLDRSYQLPLFDPRKANSSKSYRLWLLDDKTYALFNGPTTPDFTTENFECTIKGLKYSDINPDFSGNINLTLNDSSVPEGTYQIISKEINSSDDVSYVRRTLQNKFLQQNALFSLDQIKDYINSSDFVQSCSIVFENYQIVVYIKPLLYDDTTSLSNYDVLKANLELYGPLFTTFEVLLGDVVEFYPLIKIGNISEDDKTSIQNFLCSLYAYDNIDFDFIPNQSDIREKVMLQTGKSCYVSFLIKDVSVSNETTKLPSVPLQNSINLKNSNDEIIGYDVNGLLYGLQTQSLQDMRYSPESYDFNINMLNYHTPYSAGDFIKVFAKLGSSLSFHEYYVNFTEVTIDGNQNITKGRFFENPFTTLFSSSANDLIIIPFRESKYTILGGFRKHSDLPNLKSEVYWLLVNNDSIIESNLTSGTINPSIAYYTNTDDNSIKYNFYTKLSNDGLLDNNTLYIPFYLEANNLFVVSEVHTSPSYSIDRITLNYFSLFEGEQVPYFVKKEEPLSAVSLLTYTNTSTDIDFYLSLGNRVYQYIKFMNVNIDSCSVRKKTMKFFLGDTSLPDLVIDMGVVKESDFVVMTKSEEGSTKYLNLYRSISISETVSEIKMTLSLFAKIPLPNEAGLIYRLIEVNSGVFVEATNNVKTYCVFCPFDNPSSSEEIPFITTAYAATKGNQIGYVDYNNGMIKINDNTISKVDYETALLSKSKGEYFKLGEILWK